MSRRTIRIAMNGVTGRMGHRQHLVRSLLALREEGGLDLGGGRRLWPEPVLVGRREDKLRSLAQQHGLDPRAVSTDLDAVLADDSIDIYFDAQITSERLAALRKAVAAGKHVYAEKPTATSLDGALELARAATRAGVEHGVVQDKLFLPGLRKLARLVRGGFFGRVLSVRGEFGYWVFEGDWQSAQRPSWNYRAQDGGGIAGDMFPHWEYVLHNLFGRVTSVQAHLATHLPHRWDERGEPYRATADDSAYGIFTLEGGAVAQINSSWAVRVHRDELLEFQVDGTEGSAVAGLRGCRYQHRAGTPRPVWNPDLPAAERFRDQWQEVPDNDGDEETNGFKAQWELFLRRVADRDGTGPGDHGGERGDGGDGDARGEAAGPCPWDLLAGARGVQLAELARTSSAEGRRIEVPELAP
ncbi:MULTISPECIES: Gfo/Idh/MocA family protein [Streptomyces]|uniref:Oxidoreductase n=1 Tax=Streptomyces qinglanensis TaxID=943816 RepID=A0A1E7K1E6_9ACTN|nr:Gfo/Idh/MocA family oxidoreductase [Streptomyces qinglanensis]OEU97676.1 oxidoreductase [Streptomyces qinglanensis]OEV23416.1 oxidoreductase [Streptomyces nanshensis]